MLGGFDPSAIQLAAKLADILQELDQLIFSRVGGELGCGRLQLFGLGLKVRHSDAKDFQQFAGFVRHRVHLPSQQRPARFVGYFVEGA